MKDLAQIIRENPGCIAEIDNDCWWLLRESPHNNPFGQDEMEKSDEWERNNLLARSGEVIPVGEGYGSGAIYGGDILQALAAIVGITVESV